MQEIKTIRIGDVEGCRGCDLRSLCGTGCRANAYFLHGNFRHAKDDYACEAVRFFKEKVKTILDLACGTGSILYYFDQKGFKVCGLDISKEMIASARKKVPNASLSIQDMRYFKLDTKFDVILCLFDSINHLLSIKDWEMTFNTSFNHLNKDGVFIFDINTQYALSFLVESSPISRKFENNTFIIQVSEKPRRVYFICLK